MAYISSLDRKRDYVNTIAFAKKEALEQGIEKGRSEERAKSEAEKRESAIKMLQNGFEVKFISDIIGLPVEEIEKLK